MKRVEYKILILMIVALCPSILAGADTFCGKVVGITDGDTITVMRQQTPLKIRLYGIDCPESHQDYGTQAKKTASTLAFGKVVCIEGVDHDQYGRIIGVVTLPGKLNLNQEMVKQGMAWWYRQYAPASRELPKLEEQARNAKVGLWSQLNPVPPWDFRKGDAEKQTTITIIRPKLPTVAPTKAPDLVYVTAKGKKYHLATCAHLTKSETQLPRGVAVSQGYTPCKDCRP